MVTGNEKDHLVLNFRPKIAKMKHLLNSWKCRNLSLKGKITVINTLALSKLIYLCSILHTPEEVYAEVKNIITDFIWDGKTAKIAYSTLTKGIEDGGLKLVDLKLKVKSLNASWVRRFTDPRILANWKAAPKYFYKTNDLNFYFSCNQATLRNLLPLKFYENVHNVWSEMCSILTPSKNIIINQTIWCNRYVTIQNKPFLWQRWKEAGINKISDLINGDHFLSAAELSHKYNIQINFLEALQIKQSLPFAWRNELQSQQKYDLVDGILYYAKGEVKAIDKDRAKNVYLLFNNKNKEKPTCVEMWGELFPELTTQTWKDIFIRTFSISRETKMQSFQYRILHRTIPCRKRLFEQKIVDSKACDACRMEDNLQHFFLSCNYVRQFWITLKLWLQEGLNYELPMQEKDIIFGIEISDDISKVINYIILHAKYYIYTHRLQNNHTLTISTFKALMQYNLKLEQMISSTKAPEKFDKFMPLYEYLQQNAT